MGQRKSPPFMVPNAKNKRTKNCDSFRFLSTSPWNVSRAIFSDCNRNFNNIFFLQVLEFFSCSKKKRIKFVTNFYFHSERQKEKIRLQKYSLFMEQLDLKIIPTTPVKLILYFSGSPKTMPLFIFGEQEWDFQRHYKTMASLFCAISNSPLYN